MLKRWSWPTIVPRSRHASGPHLQHLWTSLHPSDGRVISNFMVQALRGEPLTVYGEGKQTRSFCYVDDLIEGILRLSRSSEHLPVNIVTPTNSPSGECAQAVLE